MPNVGGMTNTKMPRMIFALSSFVIRHSSFAGKASFTLIELVVVIAIIIVLSGLVLSTVGYVQKKGARSRAEAEIAAMSAALESYKADNGIYPRHKIKTDQVDPAASPIPTTAAQFLYEQLAGVSAADLQPIPGATTYFAFTRQMLSGPKDANENLISVGFIRDPFGNSYGYSTMKAAGGNGGYNPTFDLWSVADDSSGINQTAWIKNW